MTILIILFDRFATVEDLILDARNGGLIENGFSVLRQECDKSHWRNNMSNKKLKKGESRSFWPTLVTTQSKMNPIECKEVPIIDGTITEGCFGDILTGSDNMIFS